VLFDDFVDLFNGFIVFDAMNFLHVPAVFEEIRELQGEQSIIVTIPQFYGAILRKSNHNIDFQPKFSHNNYLFVMSLEEIKLFIA